MDPWTELGDGIHVRQSRAYWMNSTIMIAEGHAVLVDPGVLPSELDDTAAFVERAGVETVTLILTHDHWDHVLGRPWWPNAATIAHDGVAAALKRDGTRIAAEAARCAESHGERWERGFTPFTPEREVSGLHFAPVGPFRMVFRDAPGHCATQLTAHLPDDRLLLSADMLSDIEIPILDAPIRIYRKTLTDLAPLIEGGAIETLIPGHGSVAHGSEIRDRLIRDLLYLDTLEARIAACRAAGLDLEATQVSLSEMEYPGKDAPSSMASVHTENVRLAYETPGAPRGKGSAGSSTRKKTTPRKPGGGSGLPPRSN